MKKMLKYLAFSILILISLGLIFNQQIAKVALETYRPETNVESIKKANKQKGQFDANKVDSVSATEIIKARLNKDNEKNIIGYVSVPNMNISLPISKGMGGNNLALGAATVTKNQQMGSGNYVLASHMVYIGKELLFSPIYYHKNEGVNGQKIYLTDLKNVYEYTTIKYETIASNATYILDEIPGKKVVTLFTCNYSHDKGRVMMQGELTKIISYNEASSKIKSSFEKNNKYI